MGMDLWFREDVMRILASTHETMSATRNATGSESTPVADAYERGFTDALRAVGLGFGLALLGTNEARGSRTVYGEKELAASKSWAGTATGANRGGGRWSRRSRDSDSSAWE